MARAAQAVIDEADELPTCSCREQGRPRAEAEIMELLPAIETLQWLAEHGPRILAGERIALLAQRCTRSSAGAGRYEPLGVVGVLGPGGGAVRHAAGRRRRRADGRQRRRPQAVAARRARAASGSRASSPAPGCPRACCGVVHGHADVGTGARRRRAVAQVRFTGSARAGRAGRRGVRARRSSAACSSSAARTRRSCSPTPTSSARRAASPGRRSPTPGSAAAASSARSCVQRGRTTRFARRRCVGPRARCASATRSDPATEVGPLVDPRRAPTASRELVDDAVDARRDAALRRAARPA